MKGQTICLSCETSGSTLQLTFPIQDANPSQLWLLPARRVEALVGYLRHRHLAGAFFWMDRPRPRILGILGRKKRLRGNTDPQEVEVEATSSCFKWNF